MVYLAGTPQASLSPMEMDTCPHTQALTGMRCVDSSLTDRCILLHTQAPICTHWCPEMYPQGYTDTTGPHTCTPIHTHRDTRPHAHRHQDSSWKGPGLLSPMDCWAGLRSEDGEERSRSHHAQLGRPTWDPRIPRIGSPSQLGSKSSALREQGDQQLPHSHPSSTNPSSFTGGGGQGQPPPTLSHPGHPSRQVCQKRRLHSIPKFSVRYGDTKL